MHTCLVSFQKVRQTARQIIAEPRQVIAEPCQPFLVCHSSPGLAYRGQELVGNSEDMLPTAPTLEMILLLRKVELLLPGHLLFQLFPDIALDLTVMRVPATA
jgi:hypothetical protein